MLRGGPAARFGAYLAKERSNTLAVRCQDRFHQLTEATDSSSPFFAPWSVLRIVLILLVAALMLDVALASEWTDPFRKSGTWILVGVTVGVALRGLGGNQGERERQGDDLWRRLSLGVWIVTALGGLISLLL